MHTLYLQNLLVEVIEPSDPRAQSPQMLQGMQQDVRDLIKHGTFKVIMQEELPTESNPLTARFALAIESTVDGKVKHKALYVIG